MPPLLSCFYYQDDGYRCQRRSIDPLFYCARHFAEFAAASPDTLLQEAAECLWANTELSPAGLPRFVCRDIARWRRLANAIGALGFHGYHHDDDLLDLIASILAIDTPWKGRLAGLPGTGKAFELLVARLYVEELRPLVTMRRDHDTTSQFEVFWNQKIPSKLGGTRQIDVLIRWYTSPMTALATAVECKDTEVQVDDVEAFVTKLKSVSLDRGVMVSSVGFQSGAVSTAKAHDVALRLLQEEDYSLGTEQRAVAHFELVPKRVFFEPPDDLPIRTIDNAQHQVLLNGQPCDPRNIVDQTMQTLPELDTWPPAIKHPVQGLQVLFDAGPPQEVATVAIEVAVVQPIRTLTVKRPRRPMSFKLKELLPDASRTIPASQLPLLHHPPMKPRTFYMNTLGQAYYCTKVTDQELSFVLLRDSQHHRTLFVEGTQLVENANHYHEVQDDTLIAELRDALEEYRRLPGSPKAPE